MNLKEEYLKIVTEFVKLTRDGILNWKKQNPTTMFAETNSNEDKAMISLQKVPGRSAPSVVRPGIPRPPTQPHPEGPNTFILMIKNATTNEVVVQINSGVDKNFNGILNQLYEACEFSSEKKNLEFLKGLITNQTKPKQSE